MNEQLDAKQLSSMYEQLFTSEGGQHLLNWLKETADYKRKGAINFDPNGAYAALYYAKALDDVVAQIGVMRGAKDIGKKR